MGIEKYNDYLPKHVTDITHIKDVLMALEPSFDGLEYLLDEIETNRNITRLGDENVGRCEKEYGVNNTGKDLEIRKKILLIKKQGVSTTTEQVLKNMAKAYSDRGIDINFINEEYKLVIKWLGKRGKPEGVEEFYENILNLIPCHLGLEFEYTYALIDDYKNMTLESLKDKTIEELLTLE